MNFILRDVSSYIEIQNKTGFMLKRIAIPHLGECFTGKDYTKVLENEIEQLRNKAQVLDINAQDSDIPYQIERVDITKMTLKRRI